MKKQQLSILIASALLAATVSFALVQYKRRSQKDKPPKGAPQLDLQNPGDQSEFTTAAMESEMG